ncbi:MAG TPA: hypothetical protein VGC22_06765 [Chitinophaga sp.]
MLVVNGFKTNGRSFQQERPFYFAGVEKRMEDSGAPLLLLLDDGLQPPPVAPVGRERAYLQLRKPAQRGAGRFVVGMFAVAQTSSLLLLLAYRSCTTRMSARIQIK